MFRQNPFGDAYARRKGDCGRQREVCSPRPGARRRGRIKAASRRRLYVRERLAQCPYFEGVNMIGSFDTQKLQEVLKDFYTAVGIRISIFDDEFNAVTEYPLVPPKFCANIRATRAGREACRACDRAACLRAQKLREAHIYTCHAGLTEAITPIQLDGGVIGYAILAHMMPAEDYSAAQENACSLAARFGTAREDSLAALREIAPRPAEQIHAAARVLDALAAYVQMRNFARLGGGTAAREIEKFVSENLSGKLSADLLCKHFHCSRSSLHQIARRAFGMGIMEYVASRRIERAKRCLREGMSIAEAAAASGYEDYSYFCRAFRRAEGCSPGEYRARNA